ncbi:MAG: sigma-70 family RNA polymerase sigma factor [Chloroflexota bacterium]
MMNTTYPEISVERLKSGDRAEFARLVDLATPAIYRLGLKMLGDPQEAEDVLQNTFLKALEALPQFEGRSNPMTWLYRIGVNEALMVMRRRKPQVRIADEPENESDDITPPVQLTDWCCLPESEFVSAEARKALDEAIRTLPERLRVVFLLRDIEGLSIQETMDTLGLSDTAVKSRLLRARLHLREKLSVYFGGKLVEEITK